MALPGLVIAVAMIGDTLLYAVLPLYHRISAEPRHGRRAAVAQPLDPLAGQFRRGGDRRKVGPHALMVTAAVGSSVSTTLYGLVENELIQIAARILWGISYARSISQRWPMPSATAPMRGKAGRRSRAAIGMVQAMSLVGGAGSPCRSDRARCS
jgi:MFS family permease